MLTELEQFVGALPELTVHVSEADRDPFVVR